MNYLTLALTASTILLSALPSFAEQYTVNATSESGFPIHLLDGESQTVSVDFGKEFSSVTYICLDAKFEGDLVDPDESFMYGPFDNSSYGFVNINSSAISSRTSCITSSHTGADLFLDGKQDFGVKMSSGSATLSSLTIRITGVASATPTHSVSIALDEGEGTVPAEGGKVQYHGEIENLDLENSYKDLLRWSVLEMPNGDYYSIHKSAVVQLSAGEEKEYKKPRLQIPAWFPSGEYAYTWYVADPSKESDHVVRSTFTFQKLEN